MIVIYQILVLRANCEAQAQLPQRNCQATAVLLAKRGAGGPTPHFCTVGQHRMLSGQNCLAGPAGPRLPSPHGRKLQGLHSQPARRQRLRLKPIGRSAMDPDPDYDVSDELEYVLRWLPWALRGVYPPPAYPPD